MWFAGQLPREPQDTISRTDAIVVLTGGSGRLQQGLDLLASELAEKLFVSGVYRGVDVQELLNISRATPEEIECCIALGYEADNTRGNALETARWLDGEDYGSMRLVTASYHMPRSLLEFRRLMPDVEIIAHPVFPENYHQVDWWLWPGSARLLVSEYNKYLIALIAGGPGKEGP
jgi:uncharacterized SAM-binding protein YcdF (DUF218 family)